MSSHTKMTMAEAAVAALAGDRPVFSLGFESGLARVRGSTVTLWIEECYCAWTVDFQVSNGVAVQVDGSRSDEDCTKADPGAMHLTLSIRMLTLCTQVRSSIHLF